MNSTLNKSKLPHLTPIRMGLALSVCFGIFNPQTIQISAEEVNPGLVGVVYEFKDRDPYAISTSEPSDLAPFGEMNIKGDMSESNMTFLVSGDSVDFYYYPDDNLFSSAVDEWHFINDNTRRIDNTKLNESVGKGSILIQTSKDGKIWADAAIHTNVFENYDKSKPIYSTTELQLLDGCFYRITVVFEIEKKEGFKQFLFIKTDNIVKKKIAEVYETHLIAESSKKQTEENVTRYNLGQKVRTAKFEGYAGESAITNNDPHFGWDIGQFYVQGFTSKEEDKDGNPVFLINNNDEVVLWFDLFQNINKCNNNESISVIADHKATDQYFEIPGGVKETMDFGKGALIIRKISPDNKKETPVIYTNYLEASAVVDADTKVYLFEEGDYEVALDYGLNYATFKPFGFSVMNKQSHYRIYFKFSVRYANNIFYLFDVKTNSQLSDGATTKNGFRVDLANSQYISLTGKREKLKDSFDGITEDTLFNKKIKSGDVFTEEGIYTITATSEFAVYPTVKRIYVGSNNVLKAYVKTGKSIAEINELIAEGATITSDGKILAPDQIPTGNQDNSIETEAKDEVQQ